MFFQGYRLAPLLLFLFFGEMVESLAVTFNDTTVGKITSSLRSLLLPPDLHIQALGMISSSSSRPTIYDQTSHSSTMLVEIVCSSLADDVVKAALTSAGAVLTNCYDYVCSARISPSQLESVAALDQVVFIHRSLPVQHSGSVTSEGAAALRVNRARPQFQVNGHGIAMGVLSNSFDCLGGAAADVDSGDLPSQVHVLQDIMTNDCQVQQATDEGRAMLQLIYDLAPGAELYFRTVAQGSADFAQGIQELVNAGCQVLVDDAAYLTEPFFQDGLIARAAEKAVAQGVAYFTAAGNDPRSVVWNARQGFTDSGIVYEYAPGMTYQLHQFGVDGNGQPIIQMKVALPNVDLIYIFSFQWDEPFYSASGPPGASSDVDVILLVDNQPITGSFDTNIGADAIEILFFDPADLGKDPLAHPTVEISLVIGLNAGPPPTYMRMLSNFPVQYEFGPGSSSTVYGHRNARHVAAVGAASFSQTPAFGVTPPVAENFTSAGGTPIWFDAHGTRLSQPEIRQQPRVVGPDHVTTTFFGVWDNSTGRYYFLGTSAAAPQVAAVAALLLQQNPSLTPAELYQILEKTAVDMDDPLTTSFDVGFDFLTGYGLVDAESAMGSVSLPRPPAPSPPTIMSPSPPTGSVPTGRPVVAAPSAVSASGNQVSCLPSDCQTVRSVNGSTFSSSCSQGLQCTLETTAVGRPLVVSYGCRYTDPQAALTGHVPYDLSREPCSCGAVYASRPCVCRACFGATHANVEAGQLPFIIRCDNLVTWGDCTGIPSDHHPAASYVETGVVASEASSSLDVVTSAGANNRPFMMDDCITFLVLAGAASVGLLHF